MNQQEFDAACVELRAQRRQVMNNIKTERMALQHAHQKAVHDIQMLRDKAVKEYRDTIYDLATRENSRSAEFKAGVAMAKMIKSDALSALTDEQHKADEVFFEGSQRLRRLGDKMAHDFAITRVELIRKYNEWLEQRKAEKAQATEKGGAE